MKNLHRFFWAGAGASLAPATCMAQTVADDSAFTRHALTIGFLVLSVIILVFLGLMLKARVNELRTSLKKDTPKKKTAAPAQQLMSLDEHELDSLLRQRTGAGNGISPERKIKSV